MLALGVSVVTALSACSSSGSGASNLPATKGSSGTNIAAAEALLKANEAGKAGDGPTRADEPSTIPTGKNVWVISCGQAQPPCKGAADAVAAAGKVLGWNVTVFDGKLNPTTWNQGVGQAIVARADAIITGAIDCPPIAQALATAKAKGIVTESMFSYDCNDPVFGAGGKPLYTHIAQSAPTGTMAQTAELIGHLQAAWTIKDSNGRAKVIQFSERDQAVLGYVSKGFAEQMKTCSECKIVATIPFTIPDIGPGLVQKARTALLQNPGATYAMAPNDISAAFLNQAVTQAGKNGKVRVLGELGNPQNIATIRQGGPQVMSVGADTEWFGWAAMDDLVHIFAGKAPVYSGWSLGIVDASHLPSGDRYAGPVNYVANYTKAWSKD